MSKAMSSMRIERLNTLLRVLTKSPYISREELMSECGYISGRTLEGDLRLMREAFGMKIRYSRSRQGYFLESAGKFILLYGE